MSNEVRRYRVLETLGKGGFGTVYRAELLGTGGFAKQVALKVLNDEGQREIALRLRDEARILGLLHHRAVVGVDNLVRLEPGWAVVMEYVAGVDTTALIRYGPAPVRVVLEIIEEVASALHAAYTLPSEVTGRPLYLIHRDIKPSNLRITSRGEVKILDFGVALASFGTREARTRATLFGSFQYMAPERLDGIEGPKGDIYSLGLVMARLLSSARFPEPPKHPRRHSTFVDLVTGRVREALADVPDQVDAEAMQAIIGLVSAMISFEPAERPTARDVERFCREWRLPVEGPWLRDWAEGEVPKMASRVGVPQVEEGLTGSILNEITGGAEAALKELPVPQEDETAELTAPGPWELESGTSTEPAREQLTAISHLPSPPPDSFRLPVAAVAVPSSTATPVPALPVTPSPPPPVAAPQTLNGLSMPPLRTRDAARPPAARGGVLPAIEDEDLPTQFMSAMRTTPRPTAVRTTVSIPSTRGAAEPVAAPRSAPPVSVPTPVEPFVPLAAPQPPARPVVPPPAVEEHTAEATTARLADAEPSLADLFDVPEPHSVTAPAERHPGPLELPTIEMAPASAAMAEVTAVASPTPPAPAPAPITTPEPRPTLEPPPYEDDSIEISASIAGVTRQPEDEITLAPGNRLAEVLAATSSGPAPAPAPAPVEKAAAPARPSTPPPSPPAEPGPPPTRSPAAPRPAPPVRSRPEPSLGPDRSLTPMPTSDTLPDIRPQRPMWPIVIGVLLLLGVGVVVAMQGGGGDSDVTVQTDGPTSAPEPRPADPVAPPAPVAAPTEAPAPVPAPAPVATPAPVETPAPVATPAVASTPTTRSTPREPAATSTTRRQPTTPTSTRSEPAPTPAPAAPTPTVAATPVEEPATADGPSRVSVSGDASSVALVGSDGTRYSPPCTVPPGSYNLKATFSDGQERPAGKVTLGAGEDVTLKCNSAFRQCRK